MSTLRQQLDDFSFPQVIFRCGASGRLVPMLRGTAIRIQTLVVAAQCWEMEPPVIADEYGILEDQVQAAFAFYSMYKAEIDLAIAEDDTEASSDIPRAGS